MRRNSVVALVVSLLAVGCWHTEGRSEAFDFLQFEDPTDFAHPIRLTLSFEPEHGEAVEPGCTDSFTGTFHPATDGSLEELKHLRALFDPERCAQYRADHSEDASHRIEVYFFDMNGEDDCPLRLDPSGNSPPTQAVLSALRNYARSNCSPL
jgi:hypothetical protein